MSFDLDADAADKFDDEIDFGRGGPKYEYIFDPPGHLVISAADHSFMVSVEYLLNLYRSSVIGQLFWPIPPIT